MSRALALVTGASSGIGLALARELASRGYDLAICSSGERLASAAKSIRATGAEVVEFRADLATRDGVKRFWDEVTSLGRDIDIACINAGVGVGGLFTETNLDEELNMVALNCAGTVQLAKYVVQHMTSRNRGRILFTASIAGEMVAPREAVYAATKAFDLSLAHSIRYELRETNVSVTALQPGPTDTDFFTEPEWTTRKLARKARKKVHLRKSPNKGSKDSWQAKIMFTPRPLKLRSKGCWRTPFPATLKPRCTRKWQSPRQPVLTEFAPS